MNGILCSWPRLAQSLGWEALMWIDKWHYRHCQKSSNSTLSKTPGGNIERANGRLPKETISRAKKQERMLKFQGKPKMIALRVNLSLEWGWNKGRPRWVGMNGWPARRLWRPEKPHHQGLPAICFFCPLLPRPRPSSSQTAWPGILFIFTMNALLFGRQSKVQKWNKIIFVFILVSLEGSYL